MVAGKPCQANGCYGGWWCNHSLCKCQPPPSGGCGSGSSSGTGSTSSSSSSTSSSGSSGGVGPQGGSLSTLSFAVVGDTRPASIDDTSGYPTQVITQIWQDIEAHSPRPAFAVTTGDYMFASPSSGQAGPQLALYLGARAAFSNVTFPTMGNHECTGATTSNCGPGGADGITDNYTQFMNRLLGPLGIGKPYYSIDVNATNNAWTAKFVFIAANAWDSAQASWLQGVMGQHTTYTFVLRHERTTASTAPGVTPSDQIIKQFPMTMLIVGHTHTYEYMTGVVGSVGEIVIGNGGAPLTGGANYGYIIAEQRPDGAVQFSEHDYATNAVNQTFAVKADGTPTP
jgi:hypothetical protein